MDETKIYLEETPYVFFDKMLKKANPCDLFYELTEFPNQEKAQEFNKNAKTEEMNAKENNEMNIKENNSV